MARLLVQRKTGSAAPQSRITRIRQIIAAITYFAATFEPLADRRLP